MGNPLKKTMVYLGLADEEEVYEEETPAPARAQRERERDREEPAPAPVTPLRRPVAVRQPAAGAVNEILTVHPKQYRDAQLIDFASGLSLGLYGRIERVTSKVFLLSPENIAVSGHGGIAHADAESAGFDHS